MDMARRKRTEPIGSRTSAEVKAALQVLAETRGLTVASIIDAILTDWLGAEFPDLLPPEMRKNTQDFYLQPAPPAETPEEREVVRLWRKLGVTQRRVVQSMMKSGALEVREDEPPLLNEPKED